MHGPGILARTMSQATTRGASARAWQYHSRSDAHSKLACWSVLLDLLIECDVFRAAVREGHVGFGINHQLVGPINKTLDLVVTRRQGQTRSGEEPDLASLGRHLGVRLTAKEQRLLASLPSIAQDRQDDVNEVAVALEAKACMTEHVKSLPRLHAEILATGYLAKRASPHCITVSYSLVNAAPFFVSPSGHGRRNEHVQPESARRVLEMLDRAIPTLTESRDYGYDVVGATVIDCRNDGSAVSIVDDIAYGLGARHRLHYERMLVALCSQFRARFGR